MKKVYEAPEFLSEDVLDVSTTSDLDNVTTDPSVYSGEDDPDPSFVIKS